MTVSEFQAFHAIALQMAAALDTYEQDTQAMIAAWPDFDRYRTVSEEVDRLRMYSSGLPATSVQWAELLIAHAELVHYLWRNFYGSGGGSAEAFEGVRDHHADCIAALRSRCVRVARTGHLPAPPA
jgi:hypothetical protein